MGKTVEAVLLWVRAFYLLALFAPCLLVGAFVGKDGGRLSNILDASAFEIT